jgi:hypothetical protein
MVGELEHQAAQRDLSPAKARPGARVSRRVAAPGRLDQRRRGREGERQTLAGDGVERACGVADQKHAAARHGAHRSPEWSAAAHRGFGMVRRGSETATQRREPVQEGVVIARASVRGRPEKRDADAFGADGRDVCFRSVGPVHLDVVGPGREPEMAPHAEPLPGRRPHREPAGAAHLAVQAVGAHQPARLDRALLGLEEDVVAARDDGPGRAPEPHFRADRPGAGQEGARQRRAPHAEPRSVGEVGPRHDVAVDVADAAEWMAVLPGDRDSETREPGDSRWHQPFAAGLVERTLPALDDDGAAAGLCGEDGDREPRRPGTDDGVVVAVVHGGHVREVYQSARERLAGRCGDKSATDRAAGRGPGAARARAGRGASARS